MSRARLAFRTAAVKKSNQAVIAIGGCCAGLRVGAEFASDENQNSRIIGIEIEPSEQQLLSGESQQIRVTGD